MEPDIVVEMVRENNAKGIKTSTIIGDDDSTTISRLKREVDPQIEKLSDMNHVKKNLANHLYTLQKIHRTLSVKVIRYIQKCWNYMIAQNVGNPDGVSVGLDAMSKHPFGDHSSCGDWCAHIKNPNTKFKSLPYGKCLTDQGLQTSLSELFSRYKDHCQKLAEMGSTQANESLNMTISSKAPKRYHFSGSASLNYRVAAGVAQKNIGHGYITKFTMLNVKVRTSELHLLFNQQVNTRTGLSPGVYTHKISLLRDLQHRKRKAIANTRQAKRKRIELKARKLQSNALHEKREGTTYSSEVGLVEQIPSPRYMPSRDPVEFSPETHIPAYFDLETTGLGRTSHITQMAAVVGKEEFSCFVFPREQISKEASRLTGITIKNGKMYHLNKEVEAKTISVAVQSLLNFLSKFEKKVLIVGHNVQLFDCPVFLNSLYSCNRIKDASEIVDGFLDTLSLFKLIKPGLSSYRQEYLCNSLISLSYDAHDARGDVVALQKLVEQQGVRFDSTEAKSSSFTFQYAIDSHAYSKEVNANLPSLQILISQKVISVGMAKKIAGSGLKYEHLLQAFKRNQTEGLFDLCQEQYKSSVRVTKSKKVIEKMINYFAKLSES
ncbi:uncharacterized protein LOC133194248 [Saccostrea echinata]|uniref:uncharacterized protein LOC133194248 n=1 Tax=Saccostrea echinata TaxID=191078 RepID=UPI002A80186F|nr:uncharacterized protein LOC133194248 [Saccostrea echinata]